MVRKGLPNRAASSWKNLASCVAVRPSRNCCIAGESLSYTSYPEAQSYDRQHTLLTLLFLAVTYRIAPSLGQGVNLQHGVVRRHWLKRYVCVPSHARESARVAQLMRQTTSLFLFFRTDDTDLVAQLTSLFRERVYVKTRRFRLRKATSVDCGGHIQETRAGHTQPARYVKRSIKSRICVGVTS